MDEVSELIQWALFELKNGNPIKARLIDNVCRRMQFRKRAFLKI